MWNRWLLTGIAARRYSISGLSGGGGKATAYGALPGFPRPGVVIGDQVGTDGILARRLDYALVLYDPRVLGAPAGPQLMGPGETGSVTLSRPQQWPGQRDQN
jgi:hypothetical protein